MKTSLRYLGLNTQGGWDRLVQEHLNLMQKLTAIESAQVVLERHREAKPAFRAHLVLEVPGPDFHAEAEDYTLAAALHKALVNLEGQIRTRQTNRRKKSRSNLQLGKLSSLRSRAMVSHQA